MSDELNGAAPAAPEGNTASAVSTPEVQTNTAPSMEDTMSAAFDKLNPPRSETGKYQTTKPEAPEAAAEAEPSSNEGQTQTAAPSEPAQPAIAPPQSLPAELRDEWAKAPPKLAEWATKREAEAHRRITELGETAKAHAPIRAVIERFAPTLQKTGLQPADAFARMLAVNDLLEQDARAAIGQIAEAYGVDLSAVAGRPEGEAENGEIRALKSTIANLQRQVADTTNRVTTREQREAEAQQVSLAKLVEDFSQDKVDHWADIEGDVLEQIQAVGDREPNLTPEQILKKAYDRAIKINDTVANKLSEAKRKADADKAEAEKKRKADEARRQASLNAKSPNGASPKPAGKWEDTMREVGNKLLSQ
jgi:hypothetical protein